MFDENTNELPERTESRSSVAEGVCLVDCREQMICLGPMFDESDEPEIPEDVMISSSDSLWK